MSDLTNRLQQPSPLLMAILNVTPDSFSDGGLYQGADAAVSRAMQLVEEGADLLDIGGESTRPGSRRVSAEEQLVRVLPILDRLGESGRLPANVGLSIDTTSSRVAEAALKRGCVLVNDISAGMDDPALFSVVSEHQSSIVLMHMQGTPETMQLDPCYQDVVSEVIDSLQRRVERALACGIRSDRIILDPGIGFGKTRSHNLRLIHHLERLVAVGFPVLLGCSRKRFMGGVCDETDPLQLLGATVATTTYGVMKGVKLFRVHDVKPNRQAIAVAMAVSAA